MNRLSSAILFAFLCLTACSSKAVERDSLDAVRVDARFVASLKSEGLSFPSLLADDGAINFADYDAATMAFLGCAATHGIALMGPPELSKRQRYYYGLTAPEGGDYETNLMECRRLYLDAVEFVWARYQPPTDQERAAAHTEMSACLESWRPAPPQGPLPPGRLEGSPDAIRDCSRRVFMDTGLSEFYTGEITQLFPNN